MFKFLNKIRDEIKNELHVHKFTFVPNDPRNKVEVLDDCYGKYTEVWRCECGEEKVTTEVAFI